MKVKGWTILQDETDCRGVGDGGLSWSNIVSMILQTSYSTQNVYASLGKFVTSVTLCVSYSFISKNQPGVYIHHMIQLKVVLSNRSV